MRSSLVRRHPLAGVDPASSAQDEAAENSNQVSLQR